MDLLCIKSTFQVNRDSSDVPLWPSSDSKILTSSHSPPQGFSANPWRCWKVLGEDSCLDYKQSAILLFNQTESTQSNVTAEYVRDSARSNSPHKPSTFPRNIIQNKHHVNTSRWRIVFKTLPRETANNMFCVFTFAFKDVPEEISFQWYVISKSLINQNGNFVKSLVNNAWIKC